MCLSWYQRWSCLPAYTSSWPVSPAPKPSIGPSTGNWSQGPCTGSVEHISSGSCSLGNLCTKRISQICSYILQQYIMVHHSNTECCYIQCYNENGWNMLHYKCIRKEKLLYHKDQCSVYICILPTYWFDLYSMQNFKNANINI